MYILHKAGIVNINESDKEIVTIDLTIPTLPKFEGEFITQEKCDKLWLKERITQSLIDRLEAMKLDYSNGKCNMCAMPLDCKFGHNPQPCLPKYNERVCRYCNYAVVVPTRISAARQGNDWRADQQVCCEVDWNEENCDAAKMTAADKQSIMDNIMNGGLEGVMSVMNGKPSVMESVMGA